jgi:hypothetical protein
VRACRHSTRKVVVVVAHRPTTQLHTHTKLPLWLTDDHCRKEMFRPFPYRACPHRQHMPDRRFCKVQCLSFHFLNMSHHGHIHGVSILGLPCDWRGAYGLHTVDIFVFVFDREHHVSPWFDTRVVVFDDKDNVVVGPVRPPRALKVGQRPITDGCCCLG